MPRDLQRLAAPAVFCSSVRRSFRRHSPCRNVSRQRDRLWDDRECEYDDYAAEIASYTRLRRGDRNAESSYSSTSRHTHASLPCYNDSTSVITSQSDARYFTSHFEKVDRRRVDLPVYHHASHISNDYDRRSVSHVDHDDSQQKRHKRKRRHHHHCHSQNRIEKRRENDSSSRPPRDTIAALKALAEYGDTNHGMSSVSPERYYVSPRKSQLKGSRERRSDDTNHGVSSVSPKHHHVSPRKAQRKGSLDRRSVTVVGDVGSKVTAKTEETVKVSVDFTRDNLSLGECTDDDDDDDDESVDMHSLKKTPEHDHSLPHVDHSEHCDTASTNLSVCSSAAVSSSISTQKKLHSDSIPHVTEASSTQVRDTTSNSPITNAKSSSESKTHREQLPIKRGKGGSDHSEGPSVVQLKHSPVNKEISVVDEGSKTVPDGKHSTHHKDKSSESTQNSRKKSATDDDRQKAEDDMSLPRFVTHFSN